MLKLIFGINGFGMYINMFFVRVFDGKNVFLDLNDKFQFLKEVYYFIGGFMKYVREFVFVINLFVNLYKRLVLGYEVLVYIVWLLRNRSLFIRVLVKRGQVIRVELRCFDLLVNLYFVFVVVLVVGFDGIKNKIELLELVEENIFIMSEEERVKCGIGSLLGSLEEVIKEFENSQFMREIFGDYIFEKYLEVKKFEWDDYRIKVY